MKLVVDLGTGVNSVCVNYLLASYAEMSQIKLDASAVSRESEHQVALLVYGLASCGNSFMKGATCGSN